MATCLSLDIETLAATKDETRTGPVEEKAKILQIGATVFDDKEVWTTEKLLSNSFLVNIDRYEGQEERVEKKGTVDWWATQPKHVWDSMFVTPFPMVTGLQMFLDYLSDKGVNSATKLWVRGQDFDVTIIKDALYDCGLALPMFFWTSRDVRTLEEAVWNKAVSKNYRVGDAHNALADAASQAKLIQASKAEMRRLRGE